MKTEVNTEPEIDTDLVKEVSISRSFSRKIQIEQFEPIEVFSSYSATAKKGISNEGIKKLSQQLFNKAVYDTEKNAEEYYKMKKKPF
jgi:hypothetical protein